LREPKASEAKCEKLFDIDLVGNKNTFRAGSFLKKLSLLPR
jgi:hypothetical protein